MMMRVRALVLAATVIGCTFVLGCTSGPTPPPPAPCDQACKDGLALRALRETLKLVFNVTLQGKPVGQHDITVPCLRGGKARVFGEASSNATQGATEVKLTYVLEKCGYEQKDEEAKETYAMAYTGTIAQRGTIAVQPSATTALFMEGTGLVLSGTVYDPPEPFEEKDCALEVQQAGNRLAGTMCGRTVGFEF